MTAVSRFHSFSPGSLTVITIKLVLRRIPPESTCISSPSSCSSCLKNARRCSPSVSLRLIRTAIKISLLARDRGALVRLWLGHEWRKFGHVPRKASTA